MQQNYEFLVKSGDSKPCLVKLNRKESKMLDELLSDFPCVNPVDVVKGATVAYIHWGNKPYMLEKVYRLLADSNFNYKKLPSMMVREAVRERIDAERRARQCWYGGKKMEVSKKTLDKFKKDLGIAE